METRHIDEIVIGKRKRKDIGNIDGLAASIAGIGLLHPIVITPQGRLVAGQRRLAACRKLKLTEIKVHIVDNIESARDALLAERDENVQRKALTPSEAVDLGEDLEPLEREWAKERQKQAGTHFGRGKIASERFSEANKGRALEHVAGAVGMSRPTYEAAKQVIAEGTPELVQAMDDGDVAVSLAAKVAEWEPGKQEKFTDKVKQGIMPSQAKKQVDKEEKRQKYTATGEDVVLATETYQLICGDFAKVGVQLADESVDVIITDPPYSREYLYLYELLAREASRLLKPGGSLLAMAGQSYLPEVLRMLEQHLTYHWTIAYETPGGQAVMIRHRNVNTFWKPIFWFVKGKYEGDWRGDVVVSNVNDNDKRFHDWGQSESGIGKLVADYTLPSDLVLDPFVGGGTTAVACVRLGRQFIGIDIEQEQIDITLGRLKEENAKVSKNLL